MTASVPDAAGVAAANEGQGTTHPSDHPNPVGKDEVQDARPAVNPAVSQAGVKAGDAIPGLEPSVVAFYQDAMRILQRADIPFMVGGAYALRAYTGITRHTKDFDIFLLPGDVHSALAAFDAAGYKTKMQADYWLAKVFDG